MKSAGYIRFNNIFTFVI